MKIHVSKSNLLTVLAFSMSLSTVELPALSLQQDAHPDATQTTPPQTAPSGIITTVAGNGFIGGDGNGGLATKAQLIYPNSVAVNSAGDLFIADPDTQVVRKVAASTGIITAYAGTGVGGYSGDGGQAAKAELDQPEWLALDTAGDLYISDSRNNVIRKVTAATGIITTVAGNGVGAATPGGDNFCGGFTNGAKATATSLCYPRGIAVDSKGNLYIVNGDSQAQIVEVTASTGYISIAVGAYVNGYGYSGDGGPAVDAQTYFVEAIAVDGAGNLYLADTDNCAIRKVTVSTGIITSLVGIKSANGNQGVCNYGSNPGDGGLASAADVLYPQGIAVDASGNVFIADSDYYSIRVIAASDERIYTVAGSYQTYSYGATTYVYGNFGYLGDGGPATAAELGFPEGIAVGSSGSLFIADEGNSVIRKVTGAAALPIEAPVITPAAGSIAAATPVTITSPVTGATIYYTTDGTLPSTSSTKYDGPFTVDGTAVVTAFSTFKGAINSPAAMADYLYSPAPVASPGSENITAATKVSLKDANPKATIYYTTDGSNPTYGGTTVKTYSGAISVSTTTWLQSVAWTTATGPGGRTFSGWSPITTTDFLYAPAPKVAPGSETISKAIQVTVTDGNALAQIYYTTDGTDPTAFGSTVKGYTGPITVSETTTLKTAAWTYAPNGKGGNASEWSPVVTETYTLAGAPTATTKAATSITASQAVLNGSVAANTGTAQYWFTYRTAVAPTLFSDLGTTTTFSNNGGRSVSGASYAPNSPAYSFVAKTSGSLSQIDVALSYSSGTNQAIVSLWTAVPWSVDKGSSFGTIAPGAKLGSWTVNSIPISPNQPVSITGIQGISLVAGTQYFLQVAPGAANTNMIWDANTTGSASTLYQCGGYNGTFTTCTAGYIAYANVADGAFSLIGAATASTPKTGSLTGTASNAVSATVKGLAAKTTYYFQVNASNATGTTAGELLSFTTP